MLKRNYITKCDGITAKADKILEQIVRQKRQQRLRFIRQ